jgi:hypothetical protein
MDSINSFCYLKLQAGTLPPKLSYKERGLKMGADIDARNPSARELFEFEQMKFDSDMRHKQESLKLGAKSDSVKSIKSPLALALLGGIITILASSATSYLTAHSNRQLEQEKLQSELIKKYLEVTDLRSRIDNLRFLVEAGLIPNYSENITRYLDTTPNTAPITLSEPASISSDGRLFGPNNIVEGKILDRVRQTADALVLIKTRTTVRDHKKCTGFLVKERLVVTMGYCTDGAMNPSYHQAVSIEVPGEGPVISKVLTNERIALLTLSHSIPGRSELAIEDSPSSGDRLIFPFISIGSNDYAVSMDEECKILSLDSTILSYRCDGNPGSGGAPIVSYSTGKVLGVHSWSGEKERFGVRLRPSDID